MGVAASLSTLLFPPHDTSHSFTKPEAMKRYGMANPPVRNHLIGQRLRVQRSSGGRGKQQLKMAAVATAASEGPVETVSQSGVRGCLAADTVAMEVLLERNPGVHAADIVHLQEWLVKQPHLPDMLDEELVPFLVSNGLSLERAKECIDKCMTMRTHAPELFSGRDPADPPNAAQLQAFRVARLPVRAGGRRLVAMGYAPPSVPATPFDGARSLALATALMELVALAEAREGGAEGGLVLLLDAAHAAPAHIAATPLPSLQRLLAFVQEAAPLRVDGVHVLRLGAVGRRALAMLRPFMGHALQRMMHFHSDDLQELHKEFPPEVLPEEFGGSCGSIAQYHEELVRELVARRDWLLANEARVVDESKRPGGATVGDGIFGAHGSFRALDVD